MNIQALNTCQQCGTTFVWLQESTLNEIKKKIRPNFKSLQPVQNHDGRRLYPICPHCDAYALGLDRVDPAPIFTATGERTNVHELLG
jgi:hypothetical protein